VEVSCHKVLPGPDPELTLDQVTISPPRLYRIEEIPKDEVLLQVRPLQYFLYSVFVKSKVCKKFVKFINKSSTHKITYRNADL
jgi:hypothetical protein